METCSPTRAFFSGSHSRHTGTAKTGEALNAARQGIFLLPVLCLAVLLCPLQASADGTAGAEKTHASWYGTTAHGKITANGETFNRYNLTVAHKKLPFGLVLRVKNLKNGRHVLVRVNDRGPYIPGRTLDVSLRAAQALDMVDSGVAPVSYAIISDKKGVPLNAKNAYYVHLANVKDPARAKAKAQALAERYDCSITILPPVRGTAYHALCVGPFKTFRKAEKEFLRYENQQASLRGIIEGPATIRQASTPAVVKTAEAATPVPAASKLSPDWGLTASQALCSPRLHKGVDVLDSALGAFFGVHANQPVLGLHYSVLSECPDLSL